MKSAAVMLRLAAALGLAWAVASPVRADPFPKGDPNQGKALLEKSCVACHRAMYGGDGSKIYTRPERKVRTPEQLLSRVRGCNTNAGAGWYPEEEMHVAAYLNLRYYHFK